MTLSFGLRRALALAALLVIVSVILVTSQLDTSNRIAHAEQQMIAQARALTDIVAESSLHGLAAFNQWEGEVGQRLLDNARWVAWLDSTGTLDTGALPDLADDLGLLRILLFDKSGRLTAASHAPPGRGESGERVPDTFLAPLLGGEVRFKRLGYRTGKRPGSRRFAAGVARAGGGAVVVNVAADSLLVTLEELSPGHLIRTLGAGHGVQYVAVQDETGIQASSTDQITFLPPAVDPALQPLIDGAPYATRAFDSPLGPVFEVARVVTAGTGRPVLLRVGLDATFLSDLKSDIRRRNYFRVAVFLAALVLATSLVSAWQRQSVLNREVRRVTGELRAREAEVLRAGKMAATVTLAAGVAHQIRNPLNTIHMLAQLLDRTPDLPGETGQQVRHIRDESGRIEKIVQQFLDFARPRQPEFAEFDLDRVVAEVVAIQTEAWQSNGGPDCRLEATPVVADLDRHFVIEILENLLRNAAQAVGASGRIEVALAVENDEAVITVADDGPGIPARDRDRVFDLYYTTSAEGSGVGLSLSAQMAEAMGGRLSLAEQPGLDNRGARFEIHLPVRRRTA